MQILLPPNSGHTLFTGCLVQYSTVKTSSKWN